jgi:hypothetical protein
MNVDFFCGQHAVAVQIVMVSTMDPGSYMQDPSNQLRVYVAPDVFDMLQREIPKSATDPQSPPSTTEPPPR